MAFPVRSGGKFRFVPNLIEMYYTYVLYSASYRNFYKGHCTDIHKRLKEHNSGYNRSTKHYRPWQVVYIETFNSEEEAVKREKYLKTAAGRRFLKKKITLPGEATL